MNPVPAEPGDLDLRWRSLTRPTGPRLTAERVRQWAGGAVLVAMDSDGHRHLLVAVDDTADVHMPPPVTGLTTTVRRLGLRGQDEASWVDLSVGDPAWHRPFAGLCSDVVNDLPATGDTGPAAVIAVLERWRRFWSTTGDGLSREAQTGLAGELWLLLEWLPQVTPAALTAWQGPLGGRHDFAAPALSVEVKTTSAGTGPVVHRIAGLDQLDDPVTGHLLLLSLRMVPDPLGPTSLDALLVRLREAAAAAGGPCDRLVEERLTAAGVTPADAGRYTTRLRLARQELFTVAHGFPRLTPRTLPGGAPAGVVDITYSLDTSACTTWRVAQDPAPELLSGLL